jgi:hypothetical protein
LSPTLDPDGRKNEPIYNGSRLVGYQVLFRRLDPDGGDDFRVDKKYVKKVDLDKLE